MNEKKTFVLYQSSKKLVEKLSNEQVGILLKNIFRYNANEELIDMDAVTDLAFTCIQDYLDKDTEKYNAICEKRKIAGSMGGRPKSNKNLNKPFGFCENLNNPNGFSENQKNLESESESDSEYDSESVKHAHGEYNNVLLTDAELEELKKLYPDYQKKIDYLSSYMIENGKTYRNHFAVIKRWDREDKAKSSAGDKVNKFSTSEKTITDYAGIEDLLVKN